MSYFDGIIPKACRNCFYWDGQKWVQKDSGLCDNCENMLDMFPMIDRDKEAERKKWKLLPTLEEPTWTMPQDEMMVTFESHGPSEWTAEEKDMLEEAKKRPIVYDEDCPELTEEMEKAFIAARKKKPYRGEPLTLYVSPATIEKAKTMGADYAAILGRLLDKAVEEYQAV